jgi:hypothetical protein
MNPISTTVVIILLAAGLVVGLSLTGIDLLNPWTSSAQAERIASETDHQNQMYKLEEQRKQAEYEAYVRQQEILEEQQTRRAAAELAYQQQMNAFRIQTAAAFAELGNVTFMLISALVALGLASIPLGFAIRLARSAPVPSETASEPQATTSERSDLWHDPEYRSFAIYLARQVERGQSGKEAVQSLEPKPVTMSPAPVRYAGGVRQYKDLPLAGD